MLYNCLSWKHEAQLSKTEVNKDTFAIGLSAPQNPFSTELQPPLKSLTCIVHNPIPVLSLAGAPRCPSSLQEVSPASPRECWGAFVRLGGWEDATSWVIGMVGSGVWKPCLRPGPGWRPCYLLPTGGKAVWCRSACLHAAVAIAWPPALILLMAFHTLGEVIKDSVTRHGLLLAW